MLFGLVGRQIAEAAESSLVDSKLAYQCGVLYTHSPQLQPRNHDLDR